MNLEGFSWREPLESERSGSQGSLPPPLPPGEFPVQRMSSGSFGMPPPSDYRRVPSNGPPPPMVGPPPPGYFHRTPTEEYARQSYPAPPVIPGYQGYGPHQRSGSWTHSPAHAMPPLREHSLSQNPLRNASASHVAPLNAFDSGRHGSGYWGDPRQPPPPGQPYSGHYREGSGTYPHAAPPPREYSQGREYNPHSGPPTMMPPPATVQPYAVDPAIAKTWSGQSDEDFSKIYEKDYAARDPILQPQPPASKFQQQNGFDHDREDQSHLPRPQIVKRMTSHQNETLETRKDLVGPSVKRAALNRDNSLASNRLKAVHLPEYYSENGFDPEHEMEELTDNLEQSTLGTEAEKPPRKSMGSTERIS